MVALSCRLRGRCGPRKRIMTYRGGERMKRSTAGILGTMMYLAGASAVGQPPTAGGAQSAATVSLAAFKDASLPTEARVKDLISHMTLEEKAAQLGHTAPAIPRLGIPQYNWWNEGLHGVARAEIATVFPQGIGLAASWDVPLMHTAAQVISTEFRAKYVEK